MPGRDVVASSIEALSRTGRGLPITPTAEELTALHRLYQGAGYAPLWVSAKGRLRNVGAEAITRLADSPTDGLEPEDYGAAMLDTLAQTLRRRPPIDPSALARFDLGLSLAVLRYFHDLHVGRVSPHDLGLAIDAPQDRHDYVSLLAGALGEGSIEETAGELTPPLAQYRQVREALARYRSRPPDSVAERPLLVPVPLKPGDGTQQLEVLAHKLARAGALPAPATGPAPARYEGALVEGVRRFQAEHGLAPDSVLGKETLDELNVPYGWRVHQLELTLERLRWLGDLGDEPFLLVNIPMFELTAWTSPGAAGPAAFRSGVIVGKAIDHETPVLREEMRYIVFHPYWNIPPSIAKDETVPAIRKDKDFLRKNNMEIVEGQGDDAEALDPSGDTVDRLEHGEVRARQRPGRGNALGPIKFVFPNDQNVYLHGTPAEELFDRSRRDFSHGCVRVEDPAALAAWVLRDQPGWGRARIDSAMEDSDRRSRRVNLTRPLPVVLFYATAVAEPDGSVRFARDIYQHDQPLDAALHRRG